MRTRETNPTVKTDARDEGRFPIACLLAVWLVFWFMCLLSCGISMVNAESLGWWFTCFVGWIGCLGMLGRGGRWVAEFVTGRDVK